jgi:hypothetical protein
MTDFSSVQDVSLIDAEEGLHTIFAKAFDPTEREEIVLTHDELTAEMFKRQMFYSPLAKADGHDFTPVRNVCRTCRQPGPPAHDGADHDFLAVRNICKHCGSGSDMHKASGLSASLALTKALGDQVTSFTKARILADATVREVYAATTEELVRKALPDLTTQDRQQMAETGIAMPDGSFPIPDEAHLHAAIRLVGQAQDPQSAMNHIIERAKAMGMEQALPPAWNAGDPSQTAGQPQIGDGAHSLNVGKPAPAQSTNVRPTPGAGVTPPGGGATLATPPNAALASDTKPGLMAKMMKAVAAAMGAGFDEATFTKEMGLNLDPEFEYAVVKASGEKRYTLGPVYMPDTLDAHGEWTSANDLEDAAFAYFKSEDHNIYIQHSDQKAGELVALMPWPHEVEAVMTKSVDGMAKSQSTTFPAGTVYAGVVWEPWAYAEVKKGNISGFSMGGWAKRLEGAPAV